MRKVQPTVKPTPAKVPDKPNHIGEDVHWAKEPNLVEGNHANRQFHTEPDKQLKHYRHPKPMKVDIVTTLCTHELFFELRDWLPAVRVAYPATPILVWTDMPEESLQNMANEVLVDNVHYREFDRETAKEKAVTIPLYSDHWKPETIFGKLDITRLTVEESKRKGVLFADSDVTICRQFLRKEFYTDVVLCPAYCGNLELQVPRLTDRKQTFPLYERDGYFNAGMWLTRSVAFMEWWIDGLLQARGDDFLEQTWMNKAPNKFHIEYMDFTENFGKWRFSMPPLDVGSIHFHNHEVSKRWDGTLMKIMAQAASAKARRLLRDNPYLRS